MQNNILNHTSVGHSNALDPILHPVHSPYQPPASSIFLLEPTSHQQSASSIFLSEQISISHQPIQQAVN
jgi:hypothetical protein